MRRRTIRASCRLACQSAWLIGQGKRYFLSTSWHRFAVRASETPEELRPRDVKWRDEAPEGKLDLLMTIDFRQTSTTIFSDVVLPAATWYEKHDLNTTDMHPFVYSFNPAIAPPWQTRTDWDAWQTIAAKFSELAATHLGVRKDVVAVPLTHDTAADGQSAWCRARLEEGGVRADPRCHHAQVGRGGA